MVEIRHLENRHDVIFLPWINFRRLVQNDMLTAVIWSKIEIETGSRIPIWRTFVRIQWHVMPDEPRATLQGERIPSAILKIVFHRIFKRLTLR